MGGREGGGESSLGGVAKKFTSRRITIIIRP